MTHPVANDIKRIVRSRYSYGGSIPVSTCDNINGLLISYTDLEKTEKDLLAYIVELTTDYGAKT